MLAPAMTDRTWTIVLGGLLALTGACKGEAPASSSESKPSEAPGTEAKPADAKTAEPAKAEVPALGARTSAFFISGR